VSFSDRAQAGQRLAERLLPLCGEDAVVLALPRGGVPVGFEVARALGAPLDVILVRKLGVPFQPELGMGAIGEGDVRIVNEDVMRRAHVSDTELDDVQRQERTELERRARRFRGDRPRLSVTGRTAIVVDDGIATGSTARAACRVARAQGAARVVLAVPVAPPDAIAALRSDADEVIAVETPHWFIAIGQCYADFAQTSDAEVVDLLDRSRRSHSTAQPPADPPVRDEEIEVHAGPVTLAGHLTVPEDSRGIVVFAHGSGSSRHSPRNQYVAKVLGEAGLTTLLFDLLTRDEEPSRANVFDIELLADRLAGVTEWLRARPEGAHARIGYFGASTGAAAALRAAAEPGRADITAVVSRGGRPDLTGARLVDVRAPTLLIVGGHDDVVLELNQQAQSQMRCENELAVVPGATHLFDEPGTLEQAAVLARDWFVRHFQARD
jgi:putative phosphoribosyl transferase